MTDHGEDLLHERINIRGEIENIRAVLGEREKLLNERLANQKENLRLAQETFRTENVREFVELQRRLDVLNHAHEQAREKERDFISREVYDKQVERIGDDIKALSNEIKTAAEPVALALVEDGKRNNERFGKLETFQSKLLGAFVLATFIIPILTGVVVYVLTRHGIPTTGK